MLYFIQPFPKSLVVDDQCAFRGFQICLLPWPPYREFKATLTLIQSEYDFSSYCWNIHSEDSWKLDPCHSDCKRFFTQQIESHLDKTCIETLSVIERGIKSFRLYLVLTQLFVLVGWTIREPLWPYLIRVNPNLIDLYFKHVNTIPLFVLCISIYVTLRHSIQLDFIQRKSNIEGHLHCRAVTLSDCRAVTLLHCRNVTLSHYHIVALSHCFIVALSHCRVVTLSHCHIVALSHCHIVTLSRGHIVALWTLVNFVRGWVVFTMSLNNALFNTGLPKYSPQIPLTAGKM